MYNTVKSSGRIRDGQSLSDSMVRSMHMILHEAMEDAVRENLIPQNPTNGTAIPKKNYREKSVLTETQIEKLLDILRDDPYWYDFFYTELMTGMRRREICGLKWEDFDESAGTLHIQRAIRYDHRALHIGETKTNEGNRKIILPQSVAEILSNKKKYALTEWIFPNPIKPEEPLHPESAYGKLQRTLAQANLPQVSFHELRHTFSTRAASNGIDPKTLAGILGHTNASFTLDTYTHVTTDMQKNAAQKIDRAFGNRVPTQEEVRQDENMNNPVTSKQTQPRFEPYKGIRRKPGTGCISQISETTWEGRYSPRVDGKKVTRNVYAGSLEECEVKLAEMIQEMKAELGRT